MLNRFLGCVKENVTKFNNKLNFKTKNLLPLQLLFGIKTDGFPARQPG
jgi:hypothetical protein